MFAAPLARLIILLALYLPFAGTAAGHAVVIETAPVDGAVLPGTPERIRIVFNEPVSLIAAQVLDASGGNVALPEAAIASGEVVEISLPPSMSRGTYVVSYRAVSLDGHPIGASLMFSIGEASASAGSMAPSSNDRAWRVTWTAIRAVYYAGLLGSVGGVLFLLLVAGGGPVAKSAARISSRLAIMGIIAAALSIGVQGGLLTSEPIAGILGAALWRTGLASTFGGSALISIAGLTLIAAGLWWSASSGRAVALAGALLTLASFAFAGHVVTAGPRWLTVPALLAHASAVAFWIGSLLPLRAALADKAAPTLVRRFSAAAVVAVCVLIAAGLVIAILQVRGFAALVTTTYGWVLLAKLALVAGLLSLAAWNKWRLTPSLARRDTGADLALHRTISAELAVVAAILFATATLGATPPPRALGEHTHMPEHHSPHAHHEHGLTVELEDEDRRVKLTFLSAQAGVNEVEISVRDESGNPVGAKEVDFVAANPAARVEPIRRAAVLVRPGLWEVNGLLLVPAGDWSVRVEALVSDFEKAIFEGEIGLR